MSEETTNEQPVPTQEQEQPRALTPDEQMKEIEEKLKEPKSRLEEYEQLKSLLASNPEDEQVKERITKLYTSISQQSDLQKQLDLQLTRLTQENQNLLQTKEAFEQTNTKLTEAQSLIQSLQDQVVQLTNEKKALESRLDQFNVFKQGMEVSLAKQNFSKEYDAIINVNNMLSLNKQGDGWEIIFPKGYKNYLDKKGIKGRRVAALGSKSGCSTMLGKIMGRDVPNGWNKPTKGLCVMLPENKEEPNICMDVSCMNQPIKTAQLQKFFSKTRDGCDEDLEKMYLTDNAIAEKLLHDFIIGCTEILLVVVNRIRLQDQMMIREVLENANKDNQKIYIIHNFKEQETLEEVEACIQEDILEPFQAQEKFIDRYLGHVILETLKIKDKEKNVEHIVYAKEDSEAGKIFNDNSTQYLQQGFKGVFYSKDFDILESFQNFVNTRFLTYFKEFDNTCSQKFVDMEYDQDDNSIPKKIVAVNPKNNTLRSIKYNSRGLIEITGDSIKKNYEVMITKNNEDGGKRLLLACDLNGPIHDEVKVEVFKVEGEKSVIKVRGTIVDQLQGVFSDKNIEAQTFQNNRSFGRFEIVTDEIDLSEYNVSNTPDFSTKFAGTLIVGLNLQEKELTAREKNDFF